MDFPDPGPPVSATLLSAGIDIGIAIHRGVLPRTSSRILEICQKDIKQAAHRGFTYVLDMRLEEESLDTHNLAYHKLLNFVMEIMDIIILTILLMEIIIPHIIIIPFIIITIMPVRLSILLDKDHWLEHQVHVHL